jgi:type IV pilus assembly protein PilB
MGVPQQKINEALDGYNKRKPIGQIFLDLKILTPDQLQETLEKQKQFAKMAVHKPLGELVVGTGFITHHRYMEVLSKHFNMAIVSLRRFFPSTSLQRAIGEAYAKRHQIVVLEDNVTGIKLALAEPDPLLMDELRRAFPSRKSVEFCLATPFEIENCLKHI